MGQIRATLVVSIVICFALVSPFVFVLDSVTGIGVQENLAQAFKFSASLDDLAGNVGLATGAKARTLPEIIGLLIYGALSLVGVIFLIVVILAGLRWMTAEANEERIHEAKTQILQGAIGLLVILGAYAITFFVFNVLF